MDRPPIFIGLASLRERLSRLFRRFATSYIGWAVPRGRAKSCALESSNPYETARNPQISV